MRARLTEFPVIVIIPVKRRQFGVEGERGHKFPNSKIAIGNMKQDRAIRLQFPLIDFDGLPRQEMRRNSIRVERIEDEQIKFVVWRLHNRQAPIAEHNITTPFRNAAEM